MDAIWEYLGKSPMLVIALLLVVAYIFTRFTASTKGVVRPEDRVPHYKRFERREAEFGDRRKQDGATLTGQDQRKGPRRDKD